MQIVNQTNYKEIAVNNTWSKFTPKSNSKKGNGKERKAKIFNLLVKIDYNVISNVFDTLKEKSI